MYDWDSFSEEHFTQNCKKCGMLITVRYKVALISAKYFTRFCKSSSKNSFFQNILVYSEYAIQFCLEETDYSDEEFLKVANITLKALNLHVSI